MTLRTQLTNQLSHLAGSSGPQTSTATLSGPDQVALEIDFVAVDSMSCSFRELRIHVPDLASAGFDVLKSWAEALSKRVTYLLENLGPLEFDPDAGEVLLRSTKPDTADGTQYYEILLKTSTAGSFSLRRYRAEKGIPGRTPVDLQTTHEVLHKLVRDLVETIPAKA